MSDRYLRDLILTGVVNGSDATSQDYSDALRVLRDASTRYYQLDDVCGEALASFAQVQLMAAMIRKHSPVPF